MGAAALPLADDVITLGDQVGGAPELEIGERLAEAGHERLDVVAAPARLVKRVSEQHVRRRDGVDDREIAGLTPELGEPSTDDRLVVALRAHGNSSGLRSRLCVAILAPKLGRRFALRIPVLAPHSET